MGPTEGGLRQGLPCSVGTALTHILQVHLGPAHQLGRHPWPHCPREPEARSPLTEQHTWESGDAASLQQASHPVSPAEPAGGCSSMLGSRDPTNMVAPCHPNTCLFPSYCLFYNNNSNLTKQDPLICQPSSWHRALGIPAPALDSVPLSPDMCTHLVPPWASLSQGR